MTRDPELARKVALACRILASQGLFKETTGHVSARNRDGGTMLIRGRGREESGLLFTRPGDIVLADLEGRGIRRGSRLAPPNEACIHGELYKARAEVSSVVHAHPASVVLCSIAGIELRPIYGGYDPQGMRLAIQGIPVYRSSLTLHDREQVRAMMEVMGGSDVCILRGHGVVVVGGSIEEATVKSIKLEALAQMNLRAASLGSVPSISEEDIRVFLTERGLGGRSFEPVWRYYSRCVEKRTVKV
jgi:ribulose-5-phosphate 4-epimerase/fuculose-1-phosphate aldolase